MALMMAGLESLERFSFAKVELVTRLDGYCCASFTFVKLYENIYQCF